MTAAASKLSVSRTTLVAAIRDSANATIDARVASGDITSDQADDLKAEVADNLKDAYRFSSTSTVASNLGMTTAALNAAFLAARQDLLKAQIDAALAAGKVTADQATALEAKVAALTAGYKASRLGGDAFGFFGGGHHHS